MAELDAKWFTPVESLSLDEIYRMFKERLHREENEACAGVGRAAQTVIKAIVKDCIEGRKILAQYKEVGDSCSK